MTPGVDTNRSWRVISSKQFESIEVCSLSDPSLIPITSSTLTF